MRKITIAVAVIVAVMLFSGMLLAQEQKEFKEQKELKCKATCKLGLNLDEAQRKQLQELKYDLKMAAIDLKADLNKLRLQMKREFMKDDPSKKEIDRLVSEIGTLQTKMKKLRIDHLFKAKEILKPEQWKMYIKQWGMKRGRRGMAGCRPGGRGGRMKRRMRMHRGCGPGCVHDSGLSCGSDCGHGMGFLFGSGCCPEMGQGCCEQEMIWFDSGHAEDLGRHVEIIKEHSGRI